MTTSPAAGDDGLSDFEQRLAAMVVADAAGFGTDLEDPIQRRHFRAGLIVALGWITTAHRIDKITDDAFNQLNDFFSMGITSINDPE